MKLSCFLLAMGLLFACTPPSPGPLGPLGPLGPPDITDSPSSPQAPSLLCPTTIDESIAPPSEGAFIPQETELLGFRPTCNSVVHATAGARQSTLSIQLSQWTGSQPAILNITNLHGTPLATAVPVDEGESLEVSLSHSGEILIHLEPQDPHEPTNDYGLRVACAAGCDNEFTRYPVVLLHGLGGSQSFGENDYFKDVRSEMQALGYAVYTPTVSPFATPQQRASEWERHLDNLVRNGDGRRFNLIGHSLGGLDARYLVSGLGRADLVASVITIGTPHHGTPIADLFCGATDEGLLNRTHVEIGSEIFTRLFNLEYEDNSIVEAITSISSHSAAEFNRDIIDHSDVYYASWAGRSCGSFHEDCQALCEDQKVGPLLAPSHLILRLQGEASDGIIPTESAVWGDYQGEICADHTDQIGAFSSRSGRTFDHLAFYHQEFRRLSEREL